MVRLYCGNIPPATKSGDVLLEDGKHLWVRFERQHPPS